MSPKIPIVTPSELIKILEKLGYTRQRQKGSHIIFRHNERPGKHVCVPFHRKDLSPNTLKLILEQAGLTVEQFTDLR